MLTYRGYNSYGYAIKTENNFFVVKELGIVKKDDFVFNKKSKIGIGHTRWSTHGTIGKKNSHPQFDCSNKIAVVQNGS